MDGLSTAINEMAAAGEGWKAAEQAVVGSQRELSFAQYRLDMENQQAMGTLADEVKQEIEERIKDALEQFIRTGEIPLNVSSFMDHAENKSLTLAQGNENGIIREDGKTLGTGAVVTIPGRGNVPFKALAAAGAGTDVPYKNLSIQILTNEHGNIIYGDDGDPEMTITDPHPNVTPIFTPKPTPSSTPEPTPTPSTTRRQMYNHLGGKKFMPFIRSS